MSEMEKDQATGPVDRSGGKVPASRLALGAAIAIALAAVGVKVWQSQTPETATEQTKAEEQPDVSVMISRLEKRLKDNPDDAEGWRMLGWSLYGTAKYAEAAQAYRRATQLEPGKAEGWSALGEALVLAGDERVNPDAQTAFQKALAIDPKDPRARYFSAMATEQKGDSKAAIDQLLALLADTPAGAPWEENVRAMVIEIGKREGLKVDDRLAAIRPAAPDSGAGAQVATAGIPGPSTQQMREASGMPKGQQDAMIQGMVDGLESKLKADPKQLDRWIMLMRSRSQLGESAKAAKALAEARAAFAGDSAALGKLSEAADALGIK